MSERLIQLREKHHFSQTDVAKILNVTSALISAYEKCERKPSIDKLVQLADIYHTITDYILGRTNSTNDKILIDVSHLNDKQVEIIRNLVDHMN
jgi:transcriptional regulator with XRE-family HTH domain